jgi:drug/metabolite transporter (DMT)-like permease
MHTTTNMKGASALLGAAIIYASFGILVREMAVMFGDGAQVAFRFAVAGVLLGLWAIIFKRSVTLPKPALMKAALLGLAFTLVVWLFTVSVNLTTIANSVFLLYAGSIISSLVIGTFVLKEKLTPIKITAIALALLGLGMYSAALLSLSLGIVAAVLSGMLDGVANGLRKSLRGVNRNAVLLYQFAFCAVFSLILLLILPEPDIKIVSLWPVLVGIVFALLQIGLGNLLLYGFQHFDVNVGTIILATELLFASLLGWFLYQEVPASNEIIGGLFIFMASILSAVDIPALLKRRQPANVD